MSAQIQIRSIALAAALLVWGASFGVSAAAAPANAAPAGKCLTAPNGPTPKGQHWYYHTDRKKGRKCWFLRELKAPQQNAAQSDKATATPTAKDTTSNKPAATSAKVLKATSAAHRAPSSPAKAEPTPASSATPSKSAPQDDQAKSATPSFPPAPSASDAQASEWSDAPATAAQATVPIIWPDPRPVETIKIRKANPSPSNSPSNVASDPSRPTDAVNTAPESKNSQSSVAPSVPPGAAPAKPVQPAQLISSTAVTPVQMALVVLSALAVAGLLYHLVIKIAASRRRRDVPAYTPPVWADNRPQRVRRNEPRPQVPVQERQQPVVAREKFVDDARISLVPGASDESVHRPLRETDVHRTFAPRKAAVAPVTGAISEHENNLAQLIQNLEQLLQTRKGA